MGFWAVLAFVISSQVGSGIFWFPHAFASYGVLGLFAWGIAGVGALSIALLFADLCQRYPETGGPHVYVTKIFGKKLGFYVAFTYWVLAWLSSAPVLGTIASSVCTLLGLTESRLLILMVEILWLTGLTLLNLRGVQAAGRWELVMTVVKMVPLVVLPVIALFFFEGGALGVWNPTDHSWHSVLGQAAIVALWGFLGVEAVTAPAGSVENPKKTIPRGIFWGTFLALMLYVLNTVAVMRVVPQEQLLANIMPYGIALQAILGGSSQKWMALFVIIVCTGAMNAWILAMGQVAKGAALDGFFPSVFGQSNRQGAPVFGILVSSACLLLALLALASDSLAAQMRFVIDVSVVASIFIYGLCGLANVRLLCLDGGSLRTWMTTLTALLFCLWIFCASGFAVLAWALLLPVCGIPFHWFWVQRRKNECVL